MKEEIKKTTLEEALHMNKKCVVPIKGVSMLPMLEQKKDTVLIVPCEHPLKKYDLPLCKYRGKYLLHRVIAVEDEYYILCGDNCINTEKVGFGDVLGVAEGYYKNGKYISCKDKAYLRYAKRRCRSRWRRKLKRKTVYVIKRLFSRTK